MYLGLYCAYRKKYVSATQKNEDLCVVERDLFLYIQYTRIRT